LMERFYGYLKDGEGKAVALRQAQLDTMAREEYASPYYWAAFTLIGDMGEVEFTVAPDRTWLWVGGVALLVVVVGGGVLVWSRRR